MKNTLQLTQLFTYSTNIVVSLLTVIMKNSLIPQKSENERPHSSNSNENATPL